MLIVYEITTGASSRPPVAAHAICHGGTLPSAGHRDTTAARKPRIAATASANGDPVSAGTCGSGPVSTSNTVNSVRSCAARTVNRRSQPRTVSAGLPNMTAIARNPPPVAFAARAAPITSARSARRDKAATGNSTCVT